MKILLICLGAWTVAQLIKVAIGRIKEKRFDWGYLFGTGGMPSAHSATVSALATGIGLTYGISSVEFAISVIFALIIMYDAAGVRRAVSRQAVVLNRIMRELRDQRPIDELGKDLRELWGHSPFQVAIGSIIGVGIAFIWVLLS